jgi:hypothetical protein
MIGPDSYGRRVSGVCLSLIFWFQLLSAQRQGSEACDA